ncbi:hypothetical protein ZIOFF_024209 [Zingiber officinale]|uniref:K Homology domain-containing protein n=1 Tax=Zingiber officinale TaxID=94328 RepID=A0A8J5LG04_ZINOF|nr:hypothetical protein ZIOFF_024209 [Zingiber officinale]
MAAAQSADQDAAPLDSETNIDIPPSSAFAKVDEEENASTAEDASGVATGVEGDSATETATETKVGGGLVVKKWPGWPGDNVFRLIVPLLKVGSIIGRKGELIKKLCEETRARVRVLEAPIDTV